MTITPDQARAKAIDVATDAVQAVFTDCPEGTPAEVVARNVIRFLDDSHLIAAPDLAQTIAGMRWEYAVEMMEEEWEMVGLYGPDEPWGSEDDARYTMEAWRSPHPIRLVRRLVGPAEVVE